MADTAKSLKVFVSYSRTDVEFADQLVLALEDKGFQTILDRHDMSGGENWRERLGKLILSADAVTFILSEKSAASEICAWEVDEARRLSKRILPVTPASVANVKPPEALSDLNWIPFYADPAVPGSGFYYGVKRLEEALRVDLEWLRAQTRYSERSIEWTKSGKAEDLLLRGEALREAHDWLSKTPAGSSPPDGVREYLSASADAQQKREAAARFQIEEREKAVKVAEAAVAEKQQAVVAKARTDRLLRMLAVSALVVGVLLVALAGVGVWFASKNFVDSAERDAKLFAREANVLSAKGDKVLAMLVALSGDPAATKGLLEQWFRPSGYPAAREALARAYATNRLVMSVPTGEPIAAMAPFPDGKRFITFHNGGMARVWEVGNPAPVKSINLKTSVKRAIVFKDGERVLLLSDDGWPKVFSLADGVEVQMLADRGGEEATAIALDKDEKEVLIGGIDGSIDLWRIGVSERVMHWDALEPGANSNHDPIINGLVFISGGDGFASVDGNGQIARWKLDQPKPTAQKQIGDFIAASSLNISLDGDVLIVGGDNGRIYGFEADELRLSGDYQVFDSLSRDAVTAVLVTENAENLLITSKKGLAAFARNSTATISSTEFGSRADIAGAILVAEGQTAITGSRDGTIRQWSLERAAKPLLQLRGQGLEPGTQAPLARTISLSDDGQQALITYFNDPKATLWRNGSPEMTNIVGQTISPDGQFLVRLKDSAGSGPPSSRAREVVRLSDNVVVHTIDGEHTLLDFVKGESVLLEALNGELSIWKFGATSAEWTTGEPNERGYGGVFDVSPDGSRILAAFDNKIRIWRVGKTEPDASLTLDSDVTQASFLPDGKRFALGFRSGGIELWSIDSDRPLESFDGHTSEVKHIVFNKDGSLMTSASTDGAAVLWRIGQREQLQVFDVQGSVYSMVFDPDGKQVIIATMDGISTWEIERVALADAKTQVKLACETLERLNITGFDSRDILTVPSLRGLPNNPCVAMGITQPKGAAVAAKPVSAGANFSP